ncbi:hypothetical protein BH18THE2_BH18THE2_21840 [soil metagenome]
METPTEDKFKDVCTAIEKKPNQAYKLTMEVVELGNLGR